MMKSGASVTSCRSRIYSKTPYRGTIKSPISNGSHWRASTRIARATAWPLHEVEHPRSRSGVSRFRESSSQRVATTTRPRRVAFDVDEQTAANGPNASTRCVNATLSFAQKSRATRDQRHSRWTTNADPFARLTSAWFIMVFAKQWLSSRIGLETQQRKVPFRANNRRFYSTPRSAARAWSALRVARYAHRKMTGLILIAGTRSRWYIWPLASNAFRRDVTYVC